MTGYKQDLTRRGFSFGISALAGGLVLNSLASRALAESLTKSQISASPAEITVWIVIHPDDTTVIRVARSEMGQGSLTALPMLVAEELECDWARVQPEFIEASDNLARGRPWGDMVTAGSLAIRSSQSYLRKAGAQARLMLVTEAAERWGVKPETCSASQSVVTHSGSGRIFRYGELAEAASRRPIPPEVSLKRPEDWKLIGTSVRRFDTIDKAMGRPIYASDVRVPGMLHAAIVACPAYGGLLKSFDASAVLKMPGVKHVIPVADTAVAVVADKWWQAKKAIEKLPVTWDEAGAVGLSTDQLKAKYFAALDDKEVAVGQRKGDVDKTFAGAHLVLEADYDVPYLAHTTMEPQTCTAHVTDDRAEVWAPTQNGEGTLNSVAEVLGIDPSKVVVHKCQLGGGFGRRGLAQDWARQAVLISKAIGGPVKLIWTREEDVRHDYFRPMCTARQKAAFDKDGKLIAWKVRLSGSSISFGLAKNRLKDGQDIEMMGGFLRDDYHYDVPNFEVGYAMRNTPISVGFWRGVNHSQNGYFREAFVDELAHAQGQDPYQFRRQLLSSTPRSLAVLDEVARRADWGKARKDVYQGIALVECYESVAAHVVEISIGIGGALRVHRIVCAVDPCFVVNPKIVVSQMESAIAYGLIATTSGEITFKEGCVEQSNFHDYPALRMNEMPKVETYLVPSGDKYSDRWGGIGEPGLPPVAPALVNAVFAATGKRIRSLPLKNHGISLA
jgi:isoquinoline 1-oxidoreductase subunit beta